MADEYISRKAALEAIGDPHPLDYNARAYRAKIERIPAADVVEHKRGWWVEYDVPYEIFACSMCGMRCTALMNFCPNCGADMRGERGNEKD